jgi:hypothetical protein
MSHTHAHVVAGDSPALANLGAEPVLSEVEGCLTCPAEGSEVLVVSHTKVWRALLARPDGDVWAYAAFGDSMRS